MSCWPTAFRLAAVLMLLLAGFELFTCELVFPGTCELADPSPGDGPGHSNCGNGCICCCHHVVVSSVFVLTLAESVAIVAPLPEAERPISRPTCIDHPPRA
jgi:hypothetical protein